MYVKKHQVIGTYQSPGEPAIRLHTGQHIYPLYGILKIQFEIHNQRPQYKVPRKSLAFQNMMSTILGPPF